MGEFTRQGTFQNRDRFVEGVKAAFAKLMGPGAPGVTERWEAAAGNDVCHLAGFGVQVEFTVGPTSWSCRTSMPDSFFFPQRLIEEKFDKKFDELSRL